MRGSKYRYVGVSCSNGGFGDGFGMAVESFKTAAFNRSAISPRKIWCGFFLLREERAFARV